MKKVVGVILAGGASRRFGSPKAFARIGDQTLYDRANNVLIGNCDEIIVVTRVELVDQFSSSVRTITDLPEYVGLGPLAGVLSAMESVEAKNYIVLPCDMPYITSEVIQGLVTVHQHPLTAVKAAAHYHPLVSVWDRSVKESIREHLNKGQLSVMQLMKDVQVNWVSGSSLTENEENIFRNVNTPDDLERG